MDLGLDGKVALVVGGAGYLGSAIAERLRDEGCTVVTASRSSGDLRIDGTDQASVDAGIAEVLRVHDRIDVLVVSAAPSAQTLDPARSSDPDAVLDGVAGKSATFLRLANAVLPEMREAGSGRVIGISGQNAYLTSSIVGAVRNAALLIAAKSLADEHAGTGVTVNVVNPGPVVDDPGRQMIQAGVEKAVPGPSSPAQIAALVAFLASDLAAAISGEAISTGHKLRGVATL